MGLGPVIKPPVAEQPEWIEDTRRGRGWYVSTDGLGRKMYAPPGHEPEPPQPVVEPVHDYGEDYGFWMCRSEQWMPLMATDDLLSGRFD